MDNETFCSSFWNHQMIDTTGRVKPCCRFMGWDLDNNLNHKTIEEIFNSDYMKDLRAKSLKGERIDGCRRCYEEQDAGKVSLRQRVNRHLATSVVDLEDPYINYLELSISNDCNLACRMCSSRYSHRIFDDEKAYYGKTEIANKRTRSNIDAAYKLLDKLLFIKFTGGEPLMIKEHWELLQEAVDRGIAGKIALNYSTNCTIWPKRKHRELWKHFRKVELCISLDSIVKEENEYQRHFTHQETAVSNIKNYLKFSENTPLVVIGRPTVTLFTVYHLPETLEWLDEHGIKHNATHLTHAHHLSVTVLPEAEKNKIAKKFAEYEFKNDTTKKSCEYIVNYMMSADNSHLLSEFKKHTEFLDSRRNKDFKKVYPYFSI